MGLSKINGREFFGRDEPLQQVIRRYNELKQGEFLVIYGRRQLGKSELGREFLERRNPQNIKLVVPDSTKEDTLLHFSRDIERDTGIVTTLRHWEDLFQIIEVEAKKGKFVIIFDEIQRFLSIDKSFFSSLQQWWDQKFKYLPVMIIAMGSAIGMMQKIFLSSSAPLFGRRTWTYCIEPFSYAEMRTMFSEETEAQRIELYAIFGGTPAYLAHVKREKGDLRTKVTNLCLKKGAPLYDEPTILLKTEFKRSDRYNAILHAIASGKMDQKKIADSIRSFVEASELVPYLNTLRNDLHLLKRADPIGGKKRQGRYVIKDNYFHFWYRYIHELASALEFGNLKAAETTIFSDLPAYIGKMVEPIVHELLIAYNTRSLKGLDLNFTELGSWWSRNENKNDEVDVLAKGKDYALVGEVKWKTEQTGEDVLKNLMRKGELIRTSSVIPSTMPVKYLLVSKSGFTNKCSDEMRRVGCIGLTLKDIEESFNNLSAKAP
ncbi:ATP-binding protein [Candidatus Woesearchaeota archaeon]|nr:ATP-binding protein [Candidatus Woesearchaeota archaeon]